MPERQEGLFNGENEKPFAKLGQYLKECRKKISASQSDITRTSGISNSALSYIENGLSRPSPYKLDALAVALDTDRDYLYMLSGYLPPSLKQEKDVLDYLRNTRPDFFQDHDNPQPYYHYGHHRPESNDNELVRGEELRMLRGIRTQKEIARTCNLGQSYISSLETGSAPLTRSLLDRISNALGNKDPNSETRISEPVRNRFANKITNPDCTR